MDSFLLCVYGFICTTIGIVSGYIVGKSSNY